MSQTIETRGHTTRDGMLHLSINVGVADADVSVVVKVTPLPRAERDAIGWPKGFFEQVAGSMPELIRPPQA